MNPKDFSSQKRSINLTHKHLNILLLLLLMRIDVVRRRLDWIKESIDKVYDMIKGREKYSEILYPSDVRFMSLLLRDVGENIVELLHELAFHMSKEAERSDP